MASDPATAALARYADCRLRADERAALFARQLTELHAEDDVATPREREQRWARQQTISAHTQALGHKSVACRLAASKVDALLPWRGFLLAEQPVFEQLLAGWEELPPTERSRTDRHGAMLPECLRVIDDGPSQGAGETMPSLLCERLMRSRGLTSYPADGLFGGHGGLRTLEARIALTC